MSRVRGAVKACLAGALFLASLTAQAQQYGQWWWDGVLGLGAQGYRTTQDGVRLSTLDDRQLSVGLGLNGYLGHPAIGRFRLGADWGLLAQRGAYVLDSDLLGLSLDLDVLPRGRYSLSVRARHGAWGYGQPSAEGTPLATTLPDKETTADAKLTISSGVLSGTSVGANLRRYTFLDPGLDTESEERAYVDWVRRIGRTQNALHLDRTVHDYALAPYDSDIRTGTFDHSGQINGSWNWQARLVGIRSSYSWDGTPEANGRQDVAIDDYRFLASALRTVLHRDFLELRVEGGALRPTNGDGSDAWGASLYYRWNPGSGFHLSPFVQEARVSGSGQSYTLPRAGLEASWQRSRGAVDVVATGRAAWGRLDRSEPASQPDETQVALYASASLGFGRLDRLRTELDVEARRNDFRLSGEASPSTGPASALVPTAGLGLDDALRARLRLQRVWRGGNRLAATGLWETADRESPAVAGSYELENAYGSLEAGLGPGAATFTAGRTEVRDAAGRRQQTRYIVGSLRLRPIRILDVWASYRRDRRDTVLTSFTSLDRIEAGADLRVGAFTLRGLYTWSEETFEAIGLRTNRTYLVSLSRSFAGLLPIRTGGKRRGVVR